MYSAKRIVMNTGFLYGKMIITMIVTLYSVRLVLNALGVEDYGIYNLVAGIIAMLSFFNAALAASVQRFLSYYIGKGESDQLRIIFQTGVILHLLLGIFIVIILEIVGFYLFDGILNISENRLNVAKLVYHFMVISTFFSINAVPYDSAIIAHEDLFFDAIVGIFESLAKLGIAVWLLYYNHDRLILYGLSIALLIILIRIIKSLFCQKRYSECKMTFKLKWNKSYFKEMFFFAGWNTFGAAVGLVKNQGIAVILNLFFGTVINAAYGIAYQVNGQLRGFSENMLKALRPQIIKSEGEGNRKQMLNLSMMASKYSFFLLSLFSIPLIFEMEYVLNLWLKNVPEYTIVFCQLILTASMVNLLTIGLQTAIQATGKIRVYQSVVGGIQLMNLPIAWVLLKIGFSPYSILTVNIIIEALACSLRIFFLHKIAGLSVINYFNKVIFKILLPVLITVTLVYLLKTVMDQGFLRVMVVGISSVIILGLNFYFIGTEKNERLKIKSKILQVIKLNLIKK